MGTAVDKLAASGRGDKGECRGAARLVKALGLAIPVGTAGKWQCAVVVHIQLGAGWPGNVFAFVKAAVRYARDARVRPKQLVPAALACGVDTHSGTNQ